MEDDFEKLIRESEEMMREREGLRERTARITGDIDAMIEERNIYTAFRYNNAASQAAFHFMIGAYEYQIASEGCSSEVAEQLAIKRAIAEKITSQLIFESIAQHKLFFERTPDDTLATAQKKQLIARLHAEYGLALDGEIIHFANEYLPGEGLTASLDDEFIIVKEKDRVIAQTEHTAHIQKLDDAYIDQLLSRYGNQYAQIISIWLSHMQILYAILRNPDLAESTHEEYKHRLSRQSGIDLSFAETYLAERHAIDTAGNS